MHGGGWELRYRANGSLGVSLEVVVSGHTVFVLGFIIFVRLLALPNSSRLSSLSLFNFVATTTNELVWMLHAL